MGNHISIKERELSVSRNEEATGGVAVPLMVEGKESFSYVSGIRTKNLMGISDIAIRLNAGITVIHGENGTGKTAILKALYCATKPLWFRQDVDPKRTKSKLEEAVVEKIKYVFRPDRGMIGRMVNQHSAEKALKIELKYDDGSRTELSWGRQASEHIGMVSGIKSQSSEVIYIPPKEIISTSENFVSLYKSYQMAFEETYYDLLEMLDMPEKKALDQTLAKEIVDRLSSLIGGRVIKRDKQYYVVDSENVEYEMGLLSEGFRKIAMLLRLIDNGSLRKGSLLIWDEPESNMNPKMIEPLVDVLCLLVKMGVQIVLASHDYFIQQELQLRAEYMDEAGFILSVSFVSLYYDGDMIRAEQSDRAYKLENNAIMNEFDAIYDREQERIDSVVGGG